MRPQVKRWWALRSKQQQSVGEKPKSFAQIAIEAFSANIKIEDLDDTEMNDENQSRKVAGGEASSRVYTMSETHGAALEEECDCFDEEKQEELKDGRNETVQISSELENQ